MAGGHLTSNMTTPEIPSRGQVLIEFVTVDTGPLSTHSDLIALVQKCSLWCNERLSGLGFGIGVLEPQAMTRRARTAFSKTIQQSAGLLLAETCLAEEGAYPLPYLSYRATVLRAIPNTSRKPHPERCAGIRVGGRRAGR